jgi:putative transposase
LPGVPQHLIQRGNARGACFFRHSDHDRYLHFLAEAADANACAIHAYVLMTNHVHLLATPAERGAIGRMMQHVGRRYVRIVNDAMGRTGTLWEGRYKSCLVDTDDYLLTCYRYIELNPVRAGIVGNPAEYAWSSYRVNALGRRDELITPHEVFLRLSRDEGERRDRYRRLVAEGLSGAQLREIRLVTQRQRALGPPPFRQLVEQHTGMRAGIGTPGRPRRDP